MSFRSFSSYLKLWPSPLLLAGFLSFALPGCTIPDEEKDPGSANNQYFQSPEMLALINDSIGKDHGVPAPVVKVNKVGSVSLSRLGELDITFNGNPPDMMSRYVELEFQGNANQGGVITEIGAGVGHGPIIYWVSDAEILSHLMKKDQSSPEAAQGKAKSEAKFGDPEIATCVARITAQGFEEEYPFQTWNYCAQPKTKKDLTPRVNYLLRKMGAA